MMFSQIFIALFGCTAVALTQSSSPVFNRWACIFGLLGQPFWMYATYSSEQWGMFGITFVYTWAWWIGFRRHWLAKPRRWQK